MTVPLEQLVDLVMAELEKRVAESVPDSARGQEGAVSALNQDVPAPYEPNRLSDAARADAADDTAETAAAHVPHPKWAEGLQELLASTPARIGVWRAGTRPLTREMLRFRCDHAAAVDSIYGQVDPAVIDEFALFTVETCYENTENYLKRPDMGRIVSDQGLAAIRERCPAKPQVQIVVSDGLSANAIDANLRDVYPALLDSLQAYGLSTGVPFFVRGGRVAVMDHIGELLQPDVVVLLIGERPGLVSSQSMSAYMCYLPRKGTVESDRTVISNIHRGGTPPVEAGAHIGTIVHKMLEQRTSGVHLEL
ncbi:ethanolamine ammonia-lyase subunit EutC [Paenibacillus aestuarii]|uniref:Ethanolamine ammonia-lyase small subunit n=1 Tax=Paenibacillus aestuarii TaxID=516965 RepID=A0ABW0K5D1_9BACL|nr:ethanolamine ammonia-lyase subunit EutC [Paenibacillus aestuarii]